MKRTGRCKSAISSQFNINRKIGAPVLAAQIDVRPLPRMSRFETRPQNGQDRGYGFSGVGTGDRIACAVRGRVRSLPQAQRLSFRRRARWETIVTIRKSCGPVRVCPGRRGPARSQPHDFRIRTNDLAMKSVAGLSHRCFGVVGSSLVQKRRRLTPSDCGSANGRVPPTFSGIRRRSCR
jgi:hypothetical protein